MYDVRASFDSGFAAVIEIVIAVAALAIVAVTITLTMRAVVHARDLSESRAIQLERLNEEFQRVANRATKLLDVTTALSEARTVDEVTAVVLGKGLEVVEACARRARLRRRRSVSSSSAFVG